MPRTLLRVMILFDGQKKMGSDPMKDFIEFDRAYFIQTRLEIDTEKRERDRILNFAVVVLGALGFAVVQSDNAQEIFKQPHSLAFQVSTLIILTSLFFARRMKLRQIADRWYTLSHMLKRYYGEDRAATYMEVVVLRGFKHARYVKKDVVLCLSLSLPIYSLVGVTSLSLFLPLGLRLAIPFVIIGTHVFVSLCILGRKLTDPFTESCREREAKEIVGQGDDKKGDIENASE